MAETLLEHVAAYAATRESVTGPLATPIPGLAIVRAAELNNKQHDIPNPLICLILQGRKQVTIGEGSWTFGAGDSLLITAAMPMVSCVLETSPERPYLSVILDLDPALIADLLTEVGAGQPGRAAAVQVWPTDAEVADVALRLIRLLERPEAIPVLHGALRRELHYWLLMGKHGPSIRRLGLPEGPTPGIARAIAILRARFREAIPGEQLAAVAGMSLSSFHHHFRASTSLSPLQFQKQLRLIEARRLILAGGQTASAAAYAVGYESVPQFTREYRRLFGLPPTQDRTRLAQVVQATA